MALILTLLFLALNGIGVTTVGVELYSVGLVLSGYSTGPLGKPIGFWCLIMTVPVVGASLILNNFVNWNHIYPIFMMILIGVFAGILYGGSSQLRV